MEISGLIILCFRLDIVISGYTWADQQVNSKDGLKNPFLSCLLADHPHPKGCLTTNDAHAHAP